MVTANNPKNCGHAETTAGELCRKEGVEDFGYCFTIHTATRVGNLEINVDPFFQLVVQPYLRKIGLGAIHGTCRYRYDSGPVTNRIGCIYDQIHDDLTNLGCVTLEQRKVIGQV